MPRETHPLDILTYVGYSTSDCGYCKASDTSHSFGVWAHILSVETYQKLVDRGWRRSGAYLYRPNLRQSCCKSYTIKLDSLAFKTDKKHRQALNRFNRFVLGDNVLAKDEQTRKKTDTFDLDSTLHAAEARDIDALHKPAHEFTTSFTASTYTAEKFVLYKKYQMAIHKDPASKVTSSSFKKFLCDSPLQAQSRQDGDSTLRLQNGTVLPYGSCHQLYRLDGKLIAMGVLDILPHCVSSVYFIYDPDYAHLSLGRVSACRESCLAKTLANCTDEQTRRGGWYYMGFYIPSCSKMVYKGQYRPSYLLDPFCSLSVPQWFPLEDFRKRWDERRASEGDDLDWFVSLLRPEPRSITESFNVPEAETSLPATLQLSQMPGLADCHLNDLPEVLIYMDGVVQPWNAAIREFYPNLTDRVLAMASVLGPDILATSIVTAD